MNTEQLIDVLARREAAVKPAAAGPRFAAAAAIGVGIGLILLVGTIGFRQDLGVSLPMVFAKAGFSGAFAAAGAAALMRLVRPGVGLQGRLLWLAAAFVAALGLGGLALLGEAPEQRLMALTYGGFPWCLVLIPAFGAPAAAALAWFARSLAPTRLTVTGAAIGAAAGGFGAMIYAMYCPIDGIAFVTIWYGLAIALSAALGAVFSGWLLRW
jgi:hypothetical protein